MTIASAKKVKLISSKGQIIKSNPGEEFLILSIEAQNNYSNPLNFDAQNLIRLIKDQDKKYAPDFYNGAVEIPAISTKKDEVGFVVKESEKNFKIQVGLLDKEKTELEINF